MIERVYLNQHWQFNQETEFVDLPHTNALLPWNYVDQTAYQNKSIYEKTVPASEWMLNSKAKRYFLTFEGAAHEATVYVNDTQMTLHQGGYTAFTVEITQVLIVGEPMIIRVQLDARESLNFPPFGNVIDYLTYGGLYRGVYLDCCHSTYISDVTIRTKKNHFTGIIELDGVGEGLELKASIHRAGEFDTCVYENHYVLESNSLTVSQIVEQAHLWSVTTPHLYTLDLELYEQGRLVDDNHTTFGFRDIRFEADGFYLNDEKLVLRGLNRHQSFPYVGYALPKRAQVTDATILKQELAVNAVRTAHYPQSKDFIEACDALGLLVFTEIPGWQHIGDENWKGVAKQHVAEMVQQYKNHPSIILWGVRINESPDDEAFYTQTNALAKALDPTRPTGGVRYIKKSQLLEDVYTYNDFSHTGDNAGIAPKKQVTPDQNKPYLISEFNGHMFPTKAFDDERHRLSHALRHAQVLSAIGLEKGVAGGFGWCMNDYNTHQDFGSGDGICYHGVMDGFRNPKLAASVYASQGDMETVGPVLKVSSGMHIGDHPGGFIGDVWAFTNADCVKVYKNDTYVGTFNPDYETYGGLTHPPIRMDDFIGDLLITNEGYDLKTAKSIKQVLNAIAKHGPEGLPLREKLKMLKLMLFKGMTVEKGTKLFYKYVANWGDAVVTYRFDAVVKGSVIKSVTKGPNSQVDLRVLVDTDCLKSDTTYDVSLVRMQAVDLYGETLPYYQEPIQLETRGPIAVIGPTCISLKGGLGGLYVRTTKTGKQDEIGKLIIRWGNNEKTITWRLLWD